jgi:hypothetical protein
MFQMLCGSALIVAVIMGCWTTVATAKGYWYSCTYTKTASPDGVSDKNFTFNFAYDDVTGKGAVLGSTQANADVHIGRDAISFMEKLETGAVQTTVISSTGDSVHSRHSVVGGGKMIPSQSYGRCETQ